LIFSIAFHYEQAIQCIEARKNVIVEKPFTTTLEEALDIEQKAKTANVVVSVFQNRRWDGDFRTIQHLIQTGTLGRIVEFDSQWNYYRPLVRNRWKEQVGPGTGLLFEIAPHLIDQALTLFGIPSSVFADILIQRDNGQTSDFFAIHLYYSNQPGLIVNLRANYLARDDTPRFCVRGVAGSYVKHDFDVQEIQLRTGLSPNDPSYGVEQSGSWGDINYQNHDGFHFIGKLETFSGSYLEFYRNIADSINSNTPTYVSLSSAVNVMKVIHLALRSSEEKRIINWEE